jgi:hypothetical protein
MPKVDAKVIQELLDEIDALQKTVENAGQEGRDKLASINLSEVLNQVRLGGKFEPDGWDRGPESDQQVLLHKLTSIRESLHAAADLDGPPQEWHIMYKDYASNGYIITWTAVGLALTALLLWAIVSNWSRATGADFSSRTQLAINNIEAAWINTGKARTELSDAKAKLASVTVDSDRKVAQTTVDSKTQALAEAEKTEKSAVDEIIAISKTGPTEDSVLMMVILLGALGGSVHFFSSLVMFIGNRKLMRSWLPYYLAMPFLGAGLAAIVYMLLRVGIINVNPSGASAGGAGIANLNLTAIYAFAPSPDCLRGLQLIS